MTVADEQLTFDAIGTDHLALHILKQKQRDNRLDNKHSRIVVARVSFGSRVCFHFPRCRGAL